ncbi:glycosyltransferase, partial [Spirochaetota bacterium]
ILSLIVLNVKLISSILDIMNKIYFLSRSYLPSITGGTLIRQAQVEYFKRNGFDVVVVVPGYGADEITYEGNIIRLPFTKHLRILSKMERIGIFEDFLDVWVKKAFNYLKDSITKKDLIFATSGGGMGIVKLGSLLKNHSGCKFVINFHDPIDYTRVNGMKLDKKFHVSREKSEKKYLSNVDLIITSSEVNKKSLQNKFPLLKNKIYNNYFGYIKDISINKNMSSKLHIVYGGNFSPHQAPDILAKVVSRIDNVDLSFIGNYKVNKQILKYTDTFNFLSTMDYDSYVQYVLKNCNVGFMSLQGDYLGACVPSKLFEYINFEIPILAAMPFGDAYEIVNDNKYGIACKYDDLISLGKAIEKMKNEDLRNTFIENIQRDKEKWSMERQIKETINLIKQVWN